jgi:hypothetical protein
MIYRTEAERRMGTRIKCALLKSSHSFDALSAAIRGLQKEVARYQAGNVFVRTFPDASGLSLSTPADR